MTLWAHFFFIKKKKISISDYENDGNRQKISLKKGFRKKVPNLAPKKSCGKSHWNKNSLEIKSFHFLWLFYWLQYNFIQKSFQIKSPFTVENSSKQKMVTVMEKSGLILICSCIEGKSVLWKRLRLDLIVPRQKDFFSLGL